MLALTTHAPFTHSLVPRSFALQVPEAGGRIQVKAQIALFARTFVRDSAKAPYSRDDIGVNVE
jgi:hypothetical protein